MQPTTLENTEYMVFDGLFGLPLVFVLPPVIVGAVVLLLLFALLLFFERNVIGQRNAVLFWILRAIALGVVIWMLLAPSMVQVERSTTRQSLAVVTDVSRSMATVDPIGTSDDVRWALSSAAARNSATEAADKAVAAAGIAERHLNQASQALREHRSETNVLNATTAARDALVRVCTNIEQVINRCESSDELALAKRIQEMLLGPEFDSFGKLTKALQRGRTPSQKGWRESLPDLEHRMAGIRRRIVELARSVGEREQRVATKPKSPTSRLTRAANFVEHLNEDILSPVRDTADIKYSKFDQNLVTLANQQSPEVNLLADANKEADDSNQTGLGTDLSSVFEQLNRQRQQQPMAAVLMTTDVIHNNPESADPREVAEKLKGTPVYVFPIGNTQHVRDIILQSVLAPNVAIRNDDIVIEASLQAYRCDGETCMVKLLQDGEVIKSQEIDFDSVVETRTVRFETRMSEVGNQHYQVSVEPLDDELSDHNNYDQFEVNVTRNKTKVLLAEEIPRWEFRYLKQLFRRDDTVEYDELLFRPRMIATGRREETQTFPVTVDDWDQYDVVILGDVSTERLPFASQESLVEYLEDRGGTLVMIAGHEYMPHAYKNQPIEELLPVSTVPNEGGFEDYAFYVTEQGRNHNALMIGKDAEATRLAWDFVNRNVPLYSLSKFRKPLPTARTLIAAVPRSGFDEEAEAKKSAFLCWQPIKRGRIVYLSGGDTYRLRFLRGDRLHYRLWGQLLRWTIASDLAAGSKTVRIRTDKSRYNQSDAVVVTVSLTNEDGTPVAESSVQALATRADNQKFTIPLVADEQIPGRYQGEFNQLKPGVYRVEPKGTDVERLAAGEELHIASASFTVRDELPRELLDTRCDLALAQQIADATGGQVLPPTAVEEVITLTNFEPEVVEKVETHPLWVQWKFLWIIFGCLMTEWIIRKWKGLS